MATERRKLFSTTPRKKLFSGCEDQVKTVMCMDCGYKMDTAASPSHLACPKCGGTRFEVYSIPESPEGTIEPVKIEESVQEKNYSRKSIFGNDVFQKEFTEPSNDFEEKLKKFSGKELDYFDCEKEFSMTPEDLVEKGYAEFSKEDSIVISDTAFLRDKVFSKLIVSMTKVLDLDPKILECPKESIIDNLGTSGSINPKGIILIKTAHMMSPVTLEESIQNDKPELSDWIKDSGIIGDMRIELGDRENMGVEDLVGHLKSRYSDAPKGLLDYLISNGVIKIQGNKVEVLK